MHHISITVLLPLVSIPPEPRFTNFPSLPDAQVQSLQTYGCVTKWIGPSGSPPDEWQGGHALHFSPKTLSLHLTQTLFFIPPLALRREGFHHHVAWTDPQNYIKTVSDGKGHRMAGTGDKLGAQKSYYRAPSFVSQCLMATPTVDDQTIWASLLLAGKIKLSPVTSDSLISRTIKNR